MSEGTVHVVDDDDAIRDALAWLLRSRGVPARTWPSAEAFLADWSEEMRGCLVLDVRMEGMSGPELFDRLLARGSRLPVIFLTGHGDVPLAVAEPGRAAGHWLRSWRGEPVFYPEPPEADSDCPYDEVFYGGVGAAA
jgi:two-component system response regulator DctR